MAKTQNVGMTMAFFYDDTTVGTMTLSDILKRLLGVRF